MTVRPFTYGSVCSGIEAASCAWHPLGWRGSFVSEIEAFPRAVLRHRWPGIPLHGDFTTIEAGDYEPIDLLVGGTPCQSFSVAGLRGGLGDERGNLALEYLRLAERLRPRWLVWENVPGVFSSVSHDAPDPCPPGCDLGGLDGPEDGAEIVVEDEYDSDESHAFACLLAGFSELGYGFAYRVLDAQFFGVAQRRRRVFVVGHLGDWRRAAAVLFERHSLSGHPEPRRETGQNAARPIAAGSERSSGYRNDADTAENLIAATLAASDGGVSGKDDPAGHVVVGALCAGGKAAGSATQQDAEAGMLVPVAFGGNNTSGPIDVAPSLLAQPGGGYKNDFDSETFIAAPLAPPLTSNPYGDHESRDGLLVAHSLRASHDASEDGSGRGVPIIPVHAFDARQSDVLQYGDLTGPLDTDGSSIAICFTAKDSGGDAQADLAPTLRAGGHAGSHRNGGVMPAVAYGLRSDAHRSGEAKTPSADAEGRVRLRDAGFNPLEELAPTLDAGAPHAVAVFDPNQITSAANQSRLEPEVCHTLPASANAPVAFALRGRGDDGAQPELSGDVVGALRAAGGGSSRDYVAFQGRGSNLDLGQDVAGTLSVNCDRASGGAPCVAAIPLLEIGKGTTSRGQGPNGSGVGVEGDPMFTLQAGAQHGIGAGSAVRRLTPRECERLQGFEDDYTLIPWRGGLAADGPRYKALGNSMAVPVMAWIGHRIAMVDALDLTEAAA